MVPVMIFYHFSNEGKLKYIEVNDNIIAAAAVQNTNGGVIRFDLLYVPLSADGLAV